MRPTRTILTAALILSVLPLPAQHPVPLGKGSVASEPPAYKAKTTPGGPGFNATAMLTRTIYVDEQPSASDGYFTIPGRPIPTNDWWTDIINSRFSGSLWSYPAMLRTSEAGIEINFPTYWADYGNEIKSRSHITAGGRDFRASATIACDWHDWDVRFRMPATRGTGEIQVTAVHGSPFTWVEFGGGMEPRLTLSAPGELLAKGKGYVGIKVDNDLYGIYFPEEVSLGTEGTIIDLPGAGWLSVALLRSEADLEAFAPYAASIPRDTRVEWSYDEAQARVNTQWKVIAENLRDSSASAPVLQGFLPHAYKYALAGAALPFIDNEGFVTPRGRMLLAAAASGTFGYSYRFSGMPPYYAAPRSDNSAEHPFRAEVLDRLMADYASKGTFGGDTYWGGKGLTQMALNMTFARQSGNEAVYEESKRRLREALADWLSYTPGEDTFFFSYYPRWGAMLGFDVSYDSDAFNDHHFHYGYFTYAAALLCMEDAAFAAEYGEALTLIAKDYANWERTDTRFPFMRTIDPWCGHSWAGGLGDPGNDNGNGQESSSEAMQGWAGVYLLGVALGDKEMRDAGIWGWSTEARATREYWFDVDSPRPANDGGRKAWPGKGSRQGNYDYSEYPYAYNSNITGKGIGWWTWFGGDPLFMHGIQWMPVSPALDYLSWDTDFTAWAFDDMMRGANSSYSHKWFESTSNSDNGEAIEPLAANDWGNVALCYLQRSDPEEAARIFDEALERKMHIATSVSTSHISYFVTHSRLTYGEPDFDMYADIPTAQVCRKDGVDTYIVYNPDAEDRAVTFYHAGGAKARTVKAPAGRLAAICEEAYPARIEAEADGGDMIAPGGKASLSARVTDQYGAEADGAPVSFALSEGAPASISGNTVAVDADAATGTEFTVYAGAGELRATLTLTVNYPAEAVAAEILGLPEICERGAKPTVSLAITDQYGRESRPDDTTWEISPAGVAEAGADGTLSFPRAGRYTVTARSARLKAEASAVIVVAPQMPEVSRGASVMASSAENAGTMPEGACDGDTGTRWGSSHTDGEWIVADLGEDFLISRIKILWEAAYASRYELQTAPDGCAMRNISVVYAGTAHTISVPADDAWITEATEQASGPGYRETPLAASGRYVRMRSLERGTDYGVSLYELSVYGIRAAMAPDAVTGIELDLPACIDSGENIRPEVKAFTRSGEAVDAGSITWIIDKEARVDGASFTPLAHGMYNITAVAASGEGSASVYVNEKERPAAVQLQATHYVTGTDDELPIPFTVMNQFMAPYGGNAGTLAVSIHNEAGDIATGAWYDSESMVFTASGRGEYTVDFDGLATCTVSVLSPEDVNLALGKEAWASSQEADRLGARYAVDGDLSTRWGSQFTDNQWITVDLGREYNIYTVRLFWNSPAYATHYSVEVSDIGDEDDFSVLTTHEGYVRTDEPVEIAAGGIKARYIKVTGLRRSTIYGTSIDELEVYGRRPTSSTGLPLHDTGSGAAWYTLDGLRVAAPSAPGIYIRRQGSAAEKVVIR